MADQQIQGDAQGKQPQPGGGKSSRDQMVRLIKEFYKALNARDYRRLQSMMGDNHLDRTWFGNAPVKPQAVTRIFDQIQTASPDWYETLDEIISVDEVTGWCVVRATGRGTLTGNFLGIQGEGNQVATPLIHCVRIVGNKIVEYRGVKPGGFEDPFTDPIAAPSDVQAVRAEQGGSIHSRQAEERRHELMRSFTAGEIAADALANGLAEAEALDEPRCQALVQETMLRCLKAALPGSIYCEIHEQETPEVHRGRR